MNLWPDREFHPVPPVPLWFQPVFVPVPVPVPLWFQPPVLPLWFQPFDAVSPRFQPL